VRREVGCCVPEIRRKGFGRETKRKGRGERYEVESLRHKRAEEREA